MVSDMVDDMAIKRDIKVFIKYKTILTISELAYIINSISESFENALTDCGVDKAIAKDAICIAFIHGSGFIKIHLIAKTIGTMLPLIDPLIKRLKNKIELPNRKVNFVNKNRNKPSIVIDCCNICSSQPKAIDLKFYEKKSNN